MQNFERKLLTEWRKLDLPFSDKTIILAVSGGADSTALAFALFELTKRKKITDRFIIAHFNHNLRSEESDQDAGFVKDFAAKLNFEFICKKAKTGEINKKGNLEEKARDLRYGFLLETAEKTNAYAILTAHTINDQAETFLLNLIRGSGIEGLSGMEALRTFNEKTGIFLVRPLLRWAKREDTEKYTVKNKIEFRKDPMNEDFMFKRVKIRKNLIPSLEHYNPKIIENLANTSKLLRNNELLIKEILAENEEVQRLILSDYLEIKLLKNLSKAMLYRVLRNWLFKQRGNLRSLDFKHFSAIESLLKSRKSGKVVELPNFEKIKKENGKLIFQERKVEK